MVQGIMMLMKFTIDREKTKPRGFTIMIPLNDLSTIKSIPNNDGDGMETMVYYITSVGILS